MAAYNYTLDSHNCGFHSQLVTTVSNVCSWVVLRLRVVIFDLDATKHDSSLLIDSPYYYFKPQAPLKYTLAMSQISLHALAATPAQARPYKETTQFRMAESMKLYPQLAPFPRFTALKLQSLFCLKNEIGSLDAKLRLARGGSNAAGVTQDIFSARWFGQHSEEKDNPELQLMYRMREVLRQHSRFAFDSRVLPCWRH